MHAGASLHSYTSPRSVSVMPIPSNQPATARQGRTLQHELDFGRIGAQGWPRLRALALGSPPCRA
eukprot:4112522-Pleurochrysis_carterae.AAC.2